MLKRIILVSISIILVSCYSPGTGIIGGTTFGGALSIAMDKLETAIQVAGEAGRGAAFQFGTEAYTTIQLTKIAYKDMLDKSIKDLDDETTQKLQEIQTMVNEFESNISYDLDKLTMQAQQIASTLPFSDKTPQLTSYSPKFISPKSLDEMIEIKMSGVFFYAHNDLYSPSLTIGPEKYELLVNTTQNLSFILDSVNIANTSYSISLIKMKLSIPYTDGWWIFKKTKIAEYNLIVGILPPNPGQITLQRRIKKKKIEEQNFHTQKWSQHSSNDDHKNVHYSGPLHPDWRIVPSSVGFAIDWSQGDENDQWSKRLVRTNPTVVYAVTTIHHGIGTSGKVDFHFEYNIEKDTFVTEWISEDISLNWGDSKVFEVEPNDWKIVYHPFNGGVQEIVSPAKHPLIKIGIKGNFLSVEIPYAFDVKFN
ncbi:MAG: hypothetical protein KAR42_04270 [candidate division Zixibacteria bacterium]|nr:hypothetical protein [candidate division Zixibacteria bacterium]